MLCSECHDEYDYSYLFRVRNRNSKEYEFCGHGWCFPCYRQRIRYLESRKLQFFCPFCHCRIRKVLYSDPEDIVLGGKHNPIRLDKEMKDEL